MYWNRTLILLFCSLFSMIVGANEGDAIIGIKSKAIELYNGVDDDDAVLKIKRKTMTKAFVDLGIKASDDQVMMGIPILDKDIPNFMVKINYQGKPYWVEQIFVRRLHGLKVSCPKGVLAKAITSKDGVSQGFGGSCNKEKE